MFESLSPMQALNFHILAALHECSRDDLALACCRFGVDHRTASAAAALQPLEIVQVAENLGDKAVFAVADLHAVLTTPRAILPILATAFARRPSGNRTGSPPAQAS